VRRRRGQRRSGSGPLLQPPPTLARTRPVPRKTVGSNAVVTRTLSNRASSWVRTTGGRGAPTDGGPTVGAAGRGDQGRGEPSVPQAVEWRDIWEKSKPRAEAMAAGGWDLVLGTKREEVCAAWRRVGDSSARDRATGSRIKRRCHRCPSEPTGSPLPLWVPGTSVHLVAVTWPSPHYDTAYLFPSSSRSSSPTTSWGSYL
jgi:hypothetical protein